MLAFTTFSQKMILTGEKTQTRRFATRRQCVPGVIHYAQLNRFRPLTRFARIRILSVEEWDGETISEADVRSEGFTSADVFFQAYHSLNDGCKDPNKKHFVYNFEVVECIIRGNGNPAPKYVPFEIFLTMMTTAGRCFLCEEACRFLNGFKDTMCGRCEYDYTLERLGLNVKSKN